MAMTKQHLKSVLFLEMLELFEKHGYVLPDSEQQANVAIVRVHERFQGILNDLQERNDEQG